MIFTLRTPYAAAYLHFMISGRIIYQTGLINFHEWNLMRSLIKLKRNPELEWSGVDLERAIKN